MGQCIGENKTQQANEWLLKAQRPDEGAIQWMKEHLKNRLASENLFKNPLESDNSNALQKDCKSCGSNDGSEETSSALYVCLSFSLEDSLWIQFSKEIEKIGGTIVIRGLPNNSFKELADRLFELQEKGVTAPIQIHPKLFQDCDVQLVPTIIVLEGNRYDKISGNVSIKYALEKMSQQGETYQAKILYQEWKSKKEIK
jgi:conjugal transfer pilus assembly protein TrbC